MCGIVGIVSREKPVEERLLRAMRDLLSHRGPDDCGLWISDQATVGLGNRRLAILDLSTNARMPMSDHDHQLTYNGEIYNFVELRQELACLGHQFRTNSDTEVLLKAYRQWGVDCLARLNGMFAFALWDQSKRKLFAARDRFGEKPFYYSHTSHQFAFASEIKALICDPDIAARANKQGLARYLGLGIVDSDDKTFFDGILRLPPAHYLVLDDQGCLRISRYWDVDPARQIQYRDSREYVEQFRGLFLDSIRLRLRSDVPVGTSLSGGMDSSSIVCAVHSLRNSDARSQNTFSARYRNSVVDEGIFIQAVARKTSVHDHHVWIDGADLLADMDRFVYHQDEPVAHTSPFAQWKVYELARKSNVTVLLDGQGADEVLGGYPSPTYGGAYGGLLQRACIPQLVRELQAYRRHHCGLASGLRYIVAALLPTGLRQTLRSWANGSVALLDGELKCHLRDQLNPAPRKKFPSLLKSVLYETLSCSSLPSLLRYADRNSMAHSREARLPFLDHRLVEYVYAVPDHLLVYDGMSKNLLRSAMNGLLPDAVFKRTDKIGFSTPERAWLCGPLRPWLEDKLAKARRRGLVNTKTLNEEWMRVLAGCGRPANIWRAANAEAWMETFKT